MKMKHMCTSLAVCSSRITASIILAVHITETTSLASSEPCHNCSGSVDSAREREIRGGEEGGTLMEGSNWMLCRASVEGGRESRRSCRAGLSQQSGWSGRKGIGGAGEVM